MKIKAVGQVKARAPATVDARLATAGFASKSAVIKATTADNNPGLVVAPCFSADIGTGLVVAEHFNADIGAGSVVVEHFNADIGAGSVVAGHFAADPVSMSAVGVATCLAAYLPGQRFAYLSKRPWAGRLCLSLKVEKQVKRRSATNSRKVLGTTSCYLNGFSTISGTTNPAGIRGTTPFFWPVQCIG